MKFRTLSRLLAAALLLALTLTACGSTADQALAPYRLHSSAPAAQGGSVPVPDLGNFLPATAQAILAGETNRVYSPVSLYLGLAMLAEVSGGKGQEEVLTLLNAADCEVLRQQVDALWHSAVCTRGGLTTTLGSALFLSDRMDYDPELLKTLAASHHAASYQGDLTGEAFPQAIRQWLAEQTGGLLDTQTLDFPPETVLALLSTAYLQGEWEAPFSPDATQPQTFHTPGGDVSTDFMGKLCEGYYPAQGFDAVPLPMKGGGTLWLLRPEEESTPADLLAGDALYAFLAGQRAEQPAKVALRVPKFDVTADLDLLESLPGIPETATGPEGEWILTQVRHAARCVIDEYGCTAAAYTVMLAATGDVKVIDFTLDRPFLFALTTPTDLPLFLGVVNDPTATG